MRILRGPAKGLRWISGSATHGCWLGTYELDKQRALARFIKPAMTIYDIGAQAGFYTLLFSRLTSESGRVIAFEPSPRELSFLVRHVAMNHLDNVTVISAAVSTQTGTASFSNDRGETMNALAEGGSLMVRTIALDTAELPPPSLIKIDVEGAESMVLEGARETLRRARPIVFVALHSAHQKQLCSEILRSEWYDLRDLEGNQILGTPDTDEIYAIPAAPASVKS
ncbi:MAG: FkbM family methyltransferase [Candidatus Binataceae bacterium]